MGEERRAANTWRKGHPAQPRPCREQRRENAHTAVAVS
eukprot:gene21476-42497_t